MDRIFKLYLVYTSGEAPQRAQSDLRLVDAVSVIMFDLRLKAFQLAALKGPNQALDHRRGHWTDDRFR